jgi:VWFA-related protein
MGRVSRFRSLASVLVAAGAVVSIAGQEQGGVSFKSGVDLISVTATVTDGEGRFVSGLRKEDFTVYEDGQPQEITHFNNERVPVSLGIALDTSGSMTSDKMSAARAAIDRFVYDLLNPEDELFFMQFANRPQVVQQWTSDRRAISRAVSRVLPAGGTAVRRDCRWRSPGGPRPPLQEGAARNLRRERHEQPVLHRRTAQPDQGE